MSFQEAMAKMFPVDPNKIRVSIEKLRAIRDGHPIPLSIVDAATILNALVRYEASVQNMPATDSAATEVTTAGAHNEARDV